MQVADRHPIWRRCTRAESIPIGLAAFAAYLGLLLAGKGNIGSLIALVAGIYSGLESVSSDAWGKIANPLGHVADLDDDE